MKLRAKKLLEIVLCVAALLLICGVAAADPVASGTCGATTNDNVTWEVTGEASNYTLTISGTGVMADYGNVNGNAPWYNDYKGGIKTVIIENGVTSIGNWAFSGCTNLTDVTIPPSVTKIGDWAFQTSAVGIESVIITDLASWCNIDFCSGSSNPLARGNGKLYLNDTEVVDLVLPDKVTNIKQYAFYDCSIRSVKIPDSVKTIGENAFGSCNSMTKVSFGSASQLSSIGNSAFMGSGLTGITIPNSVTSIEAFAFNSCNNLSRMIFLPSTSPTLGNYAFPDGIGSDPDVLYVHGSAYKSAPKWTDIAYCMNIIHKVTLKDGITAAEEPITTDSSGNYYYNYRLTLSGSDTGYCVIDNATKENITDTVLDGNILTIPGGDVTVAKSISCTITFKVKNGAWDADGSTGDKTLTLSRLESEDLALVLNKTDFPVVGSKPKREYTAGSWDPEPADEKIVSGAETYTYTYKLLPAASITADPQKKTLTYTGTEQKLITAGSAEGGTMYYAVGTDSETAPISGWDTAIPTGKKPGKYYIWSRAVGDTAHSDSAVKYSCVSEIRKAPLTVTAKRKTIIYGDKPANGGVSYSGFVNGETETTAGLTGTLTYRCSYRQFDNVGDYTIEPDGLTAENYEITFKPGTLTVDPKSITDAPVTLDKTELTYNGSDQSVAVTGVTLDGKTLDAGTDYEVISGTVGRNKGSYTVTIRGKGNYTDEASAQWSILEKAMTVSFAGYTGTYDGQEHGITVSVKDPAGSAAVKYGTVEGTYDLDANPMFTDAGTTKVYFKITAANYEDYTGFATVAIGQAASAIVTAPVAVPDLIYTGEPQTLVTTGTASGGTMQYALSDDAATVPSSGWSTSLPEKKNAGTRYVWYRVKGDGNHTDWVTKTPVPVTIGKAEVKAPEIADQVYTGQKLTAVVESSKLYTITANDGGINAGSYDVVLTLTDADNYKWTDSEEKAKTLAFRILPADKNEVAIAIGGWTYGATPEVPTVTASFGADTAVFTYSDAEDGTFSAEVPVNAGKWYVKATVPKTENYPGGEAATGFEIAKAVSVAAAVTPNDRSYDASEQPLVTVDDSTLAGGEMRYALGKDEAAPDESTYAPGIPAGKDTGSYTVWYKVAGDENHEDTKPEHVTAVISPVDKEDLKKIIGETAGYQAQIAGGYPEIAEKLKKAIDEAQAVYDNDNVTAEQVKEQIEKLKAALEAAKKAVKDADDKKAADAVSAMIEALPMPDDITLDHAEAVEAARAACDALTEDQQALVDPEMVKKLEECEKAIAAIKEMGGVYYIYAGVNQDIVRGSSVSLGAIAKRSWADHRTFERFTGIRYEGKEVDPNLYEALEGSVEISLKPKFLNSLSVGEYKVTLMFKDGSVELPFRISEKKPAGGGGGESKPKVDPEPTVVPQTGDKANIPLWIGMVLLGLLGICAGAVVIPKRKK